MAPALDMRVKRWYFTDKAGAVYTAPAPEKFALFFTKFGVYTEFGIAPMAPALDMRFKRWYFADKAGVVYTAPAPEKFALFFTKFGVYTEFGIEPQKKCGQRISAAR